MLVRIVLELETVLFYENKIVKANTFDTNTLLNLF